MMEIANSFKVSDVISLAWSKVKGCKGTLWGVIGSAVVISLIFSLISHSLGNGFLSVLVRIVNGLIQFVMGIGLTYLAINRMMDKPIRLEMIKDICTGRILIYMICYGLILSFAGCVLAFFAFAPFLLGMMVGGGFMHFVAKLWMMVCMLAYIYLVIKLYLVKGLVIYKKLNLFDSIKESVRLTTGHEFTLFCLLAFNIVVYVLSVLCLLVGLIWSIPFILLTYGVVYRKLTQEPPVAILAQPVIP